MAEITVRQLVERLNRAIANDPKVLDADVVVELGTGERCYTNVGGCCVSTNVEIFNGGDGPVLVLTTYPPT